MEEEFLKEFGKHLTIDELCLACHDKTFDINVAMPKDEYTVDDTVYMSRSHKFIGTP